jgi:hypothetical protein
MVEGETMTSVERVRQLHESGALPLPMLRRLLGLEQSSIYKYTSESPGTSLRYEQIQAIFLHADLVEAQRAVLGDFTAGTGWSCVYIDADLDIDGDGDINTDDALASSITALEELTAFMRLVQARRPDAQEVAAIEAASSRAIQAIVVAKRVIAWIDAQRTKRRKARPLSAVAGGRAS